MSSGFDFSAFIAGFQEEAEERLQAIESTLVDLEQGQMDADQLEKLRRDAHSVKGSANMLQLRDIGESAHVLEDTFAYLRDGAAVPDQAHMNFMFELLDGLRTRIREADDPEAEQLDPDGLRDRLEGLDSAEAEDQAAAGEEAVAEAGDPAAAGEEAVDDGAPEEAVPDQEAELASAAGPEDGAGPDADSGGGADPADPELAGDEDGAALDAGLEQAIAEADSLPEEEETFGETAEPQEAVEESPAPAEPAAAGEGEPSVGAGAESDAPEALSAMDWTQFVPGLREEAEPVLRRVDHLLAGESAEGEARDQLLDDLESVSTSIRQVGLDDASEALDLIGAVLESPAAEDLPSSLRELLQGLAGRVRKRLEQADGPEARPLDRQRIGQARELLKRWGMVQGDAGATASAGEAESPAETAPEPDAADDRDQPGAESAPGGGAEPASEEPPALSGGGGSRQSSGKRSGMDVSAFLDGFQAEAREDLNVLQDGLLQAERGGLGDDVLHQMAQRAHSLKGSANMLGLSDLGEGAQVIEDGLALLRGQKLGKPGIEALLGLHDAMREVAEQVQEEGRPQVAAADWKRRLEAGGGASGEEASAEDSAEDSAETAAAEAPAAAKPQPQEGAGEARSASAEGAGKRKAASSKGTLRVSAERLERLSDGVIGLAMDRATQEDRRQEMDEMVSDFRDLRRQWEWFENILPETGPLVAQRDKLSQQMSSLGQEINRFRQQTEYDIASRHALYDEIHQRVMDLMVSPLGTIFSVLPRSARDLAQRFQKRVELNIQGSEIELERKNVDALLEPMVHLVTNAISHGIEQPEERKAAGKEPVGHIWVSAEHIGGEVAITVQDDGRGIDYEKVRETAIRTGVTTAAEAENMLPYDLLQMLFRPGFSTKEEVSQISGRGIGMNAVRDAVQRMTGSIHVDSDVGEGTSFTLNIPVSTAVQRVLKFRVGNEIFGVLANQVDRIMTLDEAALTESRGQRFFQYQGTQVPATWLAELFGCDTGTIQDTRSLRLVVVRHLEGYIGFVVNEVLEETQAVVKDVTNYLRRHAIQGLIGTTISGGGDVQLLLEPTGIKEMERTSPLTMHSGEAQREDPLRGLQVLLVEDSPLARQMEKAVLENVGMEVDTAVDGLDALDRMEVRFPDVVISDVEMPRMDGYDLLRKLRDDDRYRGVPVFMVTSRDSQEDRDTAQRLGADGFLNKLDLQSGDLIEEIRNRLERLYA